MVGEFPVVAEQKFFRCRLNELIDYKSYVVQEYAKGQYPKQIADDIIRRISYPFHMGKPDDKHIYNAYHGKWCKTVEWDYWSHASETLSILIGDCEDSSIAFCAALHALGERKVYEIFGVVRDASTNQILGGHGWNGWWYNGTYRLYESTLDTPPEEYPEYGQTVGYLKQPKRFSNVIYDPEIVYNAYNYYEVSPMGLRRQLRENIEKWKAIEEAWGKKTKVLKEWDKKSNKIKRVFGKILRR